MRGRGRRQELVRQGGQELVRQGGTAQLNTHRSHGGLDRGRAEVPNKIRKLLPATVALHGDRDRQEKAVSKGRKETRPVQRPAGVVWLRPATRTLTAGRLN
jgi:hypothetical protein